MKRKILVFLLGGGFFLFSLKANDVNAFLRLGLGVSVFHSYGTLSDESLPKVEFDFINQREYGIGICLEGIGVGFTWVNFESPYTDRVTRGMFSLFLGGTTVSYRHKGDEKLLDISFTSKGIRLYNRGRFLLDVRVGTGFRYWRYSLEEPSVYQIYIGFNLVPGFSVLRFGESEVFVE